MAFSSSAGMKAMCLSGMQGSGTRTESTARVSAHTLTTQSTKATSETRNLTVTANFSGPPMKRAWFMSTRATGKTAKWMAVESLDTAREEL